MGDTENIKQCNETFGRWHQRALLSVMWYFLRYELYKLCIKLKFADIDECEEGTDDCDDPYEICENTDGSFDCVPCEDGYMADEDNTECVGEYKHSTYVLLCITKIVSKA